MANSIYGICKKIRLITDDEFKEVEEMANSQAMYIHPLKAKRQSNVNRLGNNNLSIIEHLKIIREIIKVNKP